MCVLNKINSTIKYKMLKLFNIYKTCHDYVNLIILIIRTMTLPVRFIKIALNITSTYNYITFTLSIYPKHLVHYVRMLQIIIIANICQGLLVTCHFILKEVNKTSYTEVARKSYYKV